MNQIITENKLDSQFILRLPVPEAKRMRHYLSKNKKLQKYVSITLDPESREAEFSIRNHVIPMKLIDLPTIIESYKSHNQSLLYKTADICQMLLPENTETRFKNKENTFNWPHGLTPPLKNVRVDRFRKMLKKKYELDELQTEKEVIRLLKSDNEAVSITWELIDDDKKPMDPMNIQRLVFGEISSNSDDDSDSEHSENADQKINELNNNEIVMD